MLNVTVCSNTRSKSSTPFPWVIAAITHLKLAGGTGNPIKHQDDRILISILNPFPPSRAFQSKSIWCLSCSNGKQGHIISFNACFGAGWSVFWHKLTLQTGSCESIRHNSRNQLSWSRHNVSVSGGMGRRWMALDHLKPLPQMFNRCCCCICAWL